MGCHGRWNTGGCFEREKSGETDVFRFRKEVRLLEDLGTGELHICSSKNFAAAITDLERAVSLNPDYEIGLNTLEFP